MRNFLTRRNDNYGLDFFDDAFDNFFKPMFFNHTANIMSTDIKETEQNYEMMVSLPGFDKSDINLSLNNGYLTVSAKSEEKQTEKESYIHRESKCSCQRSYYVGDSISQEDVKAKFNNGVLTILLPKKQEKKLENKNISIE